MVADRIDHGFTKWSKIGTLILLGWFLSSWWHQTGYFHKIVTAIPQFEAARKCEDARARELTALAKSPVMVADSEIPPDACAHPKVDIPPGEHPVH